MAELLRPHADTAPDRPAIIDEYGPTSWAALDERVNRCINALRDRGVGDGDTIVVMGGNRHQTYEANLAAMHAGWIVVPVNWHWVAKELAYVIDDCGAAAVIVDGEWGDVAATATPESVGVRIAFGDQQPAGFEAYETLLADASTHEPADQSMGGPMFYTSGTTGFPKSVRSALATTEGTTEIWSLIAGGFAPMTQIPDKGAVQAPLPNRLERRELSFALHARPPQSTRTSGAFVRPSRKTSRSSLWGRFAVPRRGQAVGAVT